MHDPGGALIAKLAVRANLLTPEQFQDALKAHQGGGRPMGATLLEKRFLTSGALHSLLRDHRRRLAEKLDALYADVFREKTGIAPEILQATLGTAHKLRQAGYAVDLVELLLKREALTEEKAEAIRQETRRRWVLCPVCLEATTAPAETGTADVACRACDEIFSADESLRVVDSLVISQPSGGTRRMEAVKAEAGMLGEYKILREIGRGGMGVVYEAEQPALRRRVALKVLPSAITLDRAALERFHREARLLAQLDHPHIVKVYGSGESGGSHYYAMEFIDGRGMDQLAAETKLDLRKTAGRVRDVARALQYAHEHKLIHRDVKPANLLLERSGRVVLTDFGLARSTESISLTREGTIVGTPSYMAPEQARGERNRVDARSDVYSLGATLYHLAAGRAPFKANTPEMILQAVLNDDPEPPSKANRDIDEALETVILRAMEKDPERRYASAEALADDLDRWLAGEVIAARRVSGGEKLGRWLDRRRATLLAVCGAVVLTLGVAGGLFSGLYLSSQGLREEAERRANAALEDRNRLAREAMDAARKKQSELDQLRTRLEEEHRRQMADLERQGREAVDRIRREVEEEARNARLDRVRAAADAMKADLRTKRGAADAALASQLARETPRPDEALPALHSLRGQFLVLSTAMAGVVDPDVREVLEKDADWVATVDVRDPIRLIDDRILTVRCRDAWAGWVVERDVDASLAAIEALGREFPAEAEPQILRALLLLRAGRPTEAEPALRALRERLPDEIRLNLALAEICVAAGRSDDAQPFLERAGLAKPRPADYYYVRGLWLLAQKKIEDALVEFEIGLRQGRGSPDLAVGRARCLLALDRAKEAEDVLDGFVRTLRRGDRSAWRSWVGQSPGRRWTAYETFLLYARSCLALGDRAEARRSAEEALRERPDDEAARQLLKEIGP